MPPLAFLRRVFCGNLNAADYKEAVFDHASVWRDFTLGATEQWTPPVPVWIEVPAVVDDDEDYDDDDESTTFMGLDNDDVVDKWYSPDNGKEEYYMTDKESTTDDDDDLYSRTSVDTDGSSYAPSPRRTWLMDEDSEASFDSFEEDYAILLKPWRTVSQLVVDC